MATDLSNSFPDGSGFFSRILLLVTKQKSNEIFKRNEIQGTGLARKFPCLNAIENLWSIIKLSLRSEDCTTKTKLIEAIIRIWFINREIKKSASS